MKKVLVITYYWPPSGGAGVQRCLKFVKYLPDFNIEPIVLTVDPEIANYAVTDQSLESDIPTKTVIHKTHAKDNFKLYKKLSKKKALPHGGFTGETKKGFKSFIIRFIRGNFFIPDPRKGWVKYAYQKACEIIETQNIDTVFITSPPHSAQIIGLKLKKTFPEISWVADLRDPWTEIYYYKKLLHTFIAKAIDKRFEKKVINTADQLVVVSPSIKEMFSRYKGISSSSNITILPNGYDHEDFQNIATEQNKEFTITYTGTIGIEYNISALISAVKELNKKVNIKLEFVGSDPGIIKKYDIEDIKENIKFIDYLPHNEVIKYLVKSSLLLLVIPNQKNNKGILTGKLFEYLGSNKPIMNIGPVNGDAAKIIEECHAGQTFSYMDEQGISEFILKQTKSDTNMLDSESKNDSINKYSRKEQAKRLAELLN